MNQTDLRVLSFYPRGSQPYKVVYLTDALNVVGTLERHIRHLEQVLHATVGAAETFDAVEALYRVSAETELVTAQRDRLRRVAQRANNMMGAMDGPWDKPNRGAWEDLEVAISDLQDGDLVSGSDDV